MIGSEEIKKGEPELAPSVAGVGAPVQKNDVEAEKIATDEVAELISESPVAVNVAEERRAAAKKESAQVSNQKLPQAFRPIKKQLKERYFQPMMVLLCLV